MKHYLFGLFLVSLLSGPSHHVFSTLQQGPEQEAPKNARPPHGPMSAEQLKDLNLSDDQKERVEAIFKNQRQEMEDLRSSSGTDHEKSMSSMRHLENQVDAQLKAVLSIEQYAKYQAKKKDRPRPPKDGQGMPPQPSGQ